MTLTPQECQLADAAAERIIGWSDQVGARNYTVGNRLKNHILGMRGEVALSRLLNIPLKNWSAGDPAKRKLGDVLGIEVRATSYKTGHLMLNERDKEKLHRPFAFFRCSNDCTKYEFIGWIIGHTGIQFSAEQKDFGNKEQTWVVPNHHLRDPYELLERFAIITENKDINDLNNLGEIAWQG